MVRILAIWNKKLQFNNISEDLRLEQKFDLLKREKKITWFELMSLLFNVLLLRGGEKEPEKELI